MKRARANAIESDFSAPNAAAAPPSKAPLLFRHVSADRHVLYRAIMDVFAAAKRQFRLHLRPDEVLRELQCAEHERPDLEVLQQLLSQLCEWGNLHTQPDTSRVSSLEDFYRARFLYRLSAEGEAVEAAMVTFAEALARRAELQSVALEDILSRLRALKELSTVQPLDAAKVHGALRDLLAVFHSLAENAQAFIQGIARSIELQRADVETLMVYKRRLIEYLERFIGDLVARSSAIAAALLELDSALADLLATAARREARDAAPDEETAEAVFERKLAAWCEHWGGLRAWFMADKQGRPAQAELLRQRARSAIPQLLAAISQLNERRSGKSDRSADYQVLARWFAECESEVQAHQLYRAAFALSPARHLSLACPEDGVAASTPWAAAPPLKIHPKLRERGSLSPRGAPPKVRDRSQERKLLAAQLAEEQASIDSARAKLARGMPLRLSELGPLDRHEFKLLLGLVGEALAAQSSPDAAVQRQSSDGSLRILLEPLEPESRAEIVTELGVFTGRDHQLTVWASESRAS